MVLEAGVTNLESLDIKAIYFEFVTNQVIMFRSREYLFSEIKATEVSSHCGTNVSYQTVANTFFQREHDFSLF